MREEQRQPQSPSFSLSKIRVLVVDQDENNRDRIQFLLEDLGADVADEANGSRAADRVLNQVFDVIFLAKELPILNGLEVTKLLRGQRIKTPIIAMVDSDITAEFQDCIEAGCKAVVNRTLDVENFLQALLCVLPKNLVEIGPGIGAISQIENDVRAMRRACDARDLSRVSLLVEKLRGSIEVSGFGTLDEPARKLASSLDSTNEETLQFEEIENTIRELQDLTASIRETRPRTNKDSAGIESADKDLADRALPKAPSHSVSSTN